MRANQFDQDHVGGVADLRLDGLKLQHLQMPSAISEWWLPFISRQEVPQYRGGLISGVGVFSNLQ